MLITVKLNKMKIFKKIIAGVGLTIFTIGILGIMIYKIGYEPLHAAYVKFGIEGVFICLGVFATIGILFWLGIKFINWSIKVLNQ